MPRLFTGLELPPDIAFELDLLKGGIPGARWVEAASFHITLRFAGDISDVVADELDRALTQVRIEPFDVRLKGFGYFGGSKPRALFAKVDADERLNRLQAAHERICQTVGLEGEARKYTPHVTLARFKKASVDAVNGFISTHNLYESPPFPVTRFVLYSSRPSRGGGPYALEQTYDLERAM